MLSTENMWVGLVIRWASSAPHEWWFIGWAIRNRVLSQRYSNVYKSVVLSTTVFTRWNVYRDLLRNPLALYTQAESELADMISADDLALAVQCAADIMSAPVWCAPFGLRVQHFWSPQQRAKHHDGVTPTRPSWSDSATRVFTPEGVNPLSLVFAEGVDMAHQV